MMGKDNEILSLKKTVSIPFYDLFFLLPVFLLKFNFF